MNLAFRDIRHRPGRFFVTGVGIGLLLMMVMGMTGIYVGLVEDATLLVDAVGADLWVVQKDTFGPFAELSHVPQGLERRLEAVPGVLEARSFVAHTIQREHRGRPLRMAVRGLAWPQDAGDWLPLAKGRPINQARFEMVADDSHGLAIGTRMAIGRETYTVVGLTHGMVGEGGDGLVFVSVRDALAIRNEAASDAQRLSRVELDARVRRLDVANTNPSLVERASQPGGTLSVVTRPDDSVSAVMVNVRAGSDPAAVAAVISRWPDVTVHSAADQRALLLTGSVDKARRQIGLFRALLVMISAIIMGMIIYTMTVEKVHDIALLKLMGARNRVILGLILQQSLLLGAVGYAVAYYVGQPAFELFPRRVIIHGSDLLAMAGVVMAVSVLASIVGIWKASQVSPGEVLS